MDRMEELKKELARLKDCLQDLDDTHNFNISKTFCHIGGGAFSALEEDYEEEKKEYLEKIARVEDEIRKAGGNP